MAYRLLAAVLAAAGMLPCHAQTAAAPAMPEATPAAVVDAMEAVFGRHAGLRRNHTKGVCAAGEFTAAPVAAEFTRSPLFGGETLPVVARFSVAGGRPGTPDTARNPRGLGLRFTLPGGGIHQMALLHVPVFAAATPQSFFARLDADRPDPATGKPDPARQKAVAERFTDNRALGAWFAQHRPPASYAQAPYHSLHAFRLVDAKGNARWVRWRFVPLDGERELGEDELKTAPPDFLADALAMRLQRGPVEWDLLITLGDSGDPIDDPTQAWPATRREVSAGRLVIRQSGGTACEAINFDPLVLSDGIEPSPDPVLQFRSAAYGASFVRRLSERQEAR